MGTSVGDKLMKVDSLCKLRRGFFFLCLQNMIVHINRAVAELTHIYLHLLVAQKYCKDNENKDCLDSFCS